MARISFSNEQLVEVRALPLLGILGKLKADGTLFWRRDVDFVPEKDNRTMRLFISAPSGSAWEILVTCPEVVRQQSREGWRGRY